MNSYSYSEIQSMQKKAMERVREMQKNSDAIVELAQQTLDSSHKPIIMEEKTKPSVIKPKITNMPPNFPEEKAFPDFNEYFHTMSQNSSQAENKPENNQNVKKDNNLLENILSEPDRLLILGLLLLLKSEGNDEALIMALTYILS